MFCTAEFFILLALVPNLSVDIVSYFSSYEIHQHYISLDCSYILTLFYCFLLMILVKLLLVGCPYIISQYLYLYGTCVDVLSVSALITDPRVNNDLLMFFASSNLVPSAPVFSIFSEPIILLPFYQLNLLNRNDSF